MANKPNKKNTADSEDSFSTGKLKSFHRALALMALIPLATLLLAVLSLYTTNKSSPPSTAQTTTTVTAETVVDGLDTPWSLKFAPDGKLYFSERYGVIKVYTGGQVRTVATLTQAVEGSEEGLQGIELHPNFSSNGWLYAYYTYNSGGLKNRVVRYTLNPSTATVSSGPVTIVDAIPGYRFHNGGRIKFGPDGKLYIATGAATPDSSAQSRSSLAGKILRVNDDGSGVADNPFNENKRVYSMGHRNPQGLAWHPSTGELFATEHGPSSGAPYCCNDEVNRIVKGGNYGWPKYYGMNGYDSTYASFSFTHIKPVETSGTSSKWAPGGAMFYSNGPLTSPWTNSLLFTGLGGIDRSNQALFRMRLGSDNRTPVQVDRLYHNTYGRLRDVVQGPDGSIYLATSNRDGRGSSTYGSDKIIRLRPTGITTPTPPPPPPPTTTPPPPPSPPTTTPPPPSSSGQTPYSSAIQIPGRLEVENYDRGGQGVAYNDGDTQNNGGQYRSDGVDIESNKVGGYNIGWVTPGEWLEFTTKVNQTGKYDLTFRVATAASSNATWTLKEGGTSLAVASSTNTGGWYTFKDVIVRDVSLTAGTNKVLRLEASVSALNIDYIQFTSKSGPNPPPAPAPAPSPSTPTNPLPPVTIPDASPTNPVPIPRELPSRDDGTIIGDFNGDGLNDVVRDTNNDGQINPQSEVVIDGTANAGLTDTNLDALDPQSFNDYIYTQGSLITGNADSTVTFKPGPLPETTLPKKVVYGFLTAGGVSATGLGIYLAIAKLAIFAGFRGRMGL